MTLSSFVELPSQLGWIPRIVLTQTSSGSLNFGHHSNSLGDVTMDDSSNSVYLANEARGTNWEFWDGKTNNGGTCAGVKLGLAPHLECNNLNNAYPGKRVRCARFIS